MAGFLFPCSLYHVILIFVGDELKKKKLCLKYVFNISTCSSIGSSKVVICNIHVLYNPKRGEVKIGQVFMVSGAANTDFSFLCDVHTALCINLNL